MLRAFNEYNYAGGSVVRCIDLTNDRRERLNHLKRKAKLHVHVRNARLHSYFLCVEVLVLYSLAHAINRYFFSLKK